MSPCNTTRITSPKDEVKKQQCPEAALHEKSDPSQPPVCCKDVTHHRGAGNINHADIHMDLQAMLQSSNKSRMRLAAALHYTLFSTVFCGEDSLTYRAV